MADAKWQSSNKCSSQTICVRQTSRQTVVRLEAYGLWLTGLLFGQSLASTWRALGEHSTRNNKAPLELKVHQSSVTTRHSLERRRQTVSSLRDRQSRALKTDRQRRKVALFWRSSPTGAPKKSLFDASRLRERERLGLMINYLPTGQQAKSAAPFWGSTFPLGPSSWRREKVADKQLTSC